MWDEPHGGSASSQAETLVGARVLIVDDDATTRALLRDVLERGGAVVDEATDAPTALSRFGEVRPDVVILDVGLPRRDGWWALARLRETSTAVPIVMLTAYDSELERVRGLNAGADDYVTKPFGRQELVARVNAVLRRAGRGPDEPKVAYRDPYLEIDFLQRRVLVGEREVRLTPLEFRLLAAFVGHPNIVLAPDRLRRLVWPGSRGAALEEVKVYVGYLRRKLEPDEPAAAPIETVRGFGYRYRMELDSAGDVGEG